MAEHTEQEEPERSPLKPLQLLTTIGSPVALATALLLYFGWVRSQAQAHAFGADVSIFEMSPQDLVLRSVNILFFPIVLLLLAGLAAAHYEPRLRADPGSAGRWLSFSWILFPVALVLLWLVPDAGFVLLPLLTGMAVCGTAYGLLLRRYARGDHRRPRLVNVALVGAVLIATIFWQTERLARLGGQALADDLLIHMRDRLPAVTLFSAGQLHIGAPTVEETALQGSETLYRYSYEGLYLLQHSGDKYFLVSDGWAQGDGRLVVLPETELIRVEFGASAP